MEDSIWQINVVSHNFSCSERQKKIVQDNIDLYKLNKKVDALQEEIKTLQKELDEMGSGDARESQTRLWKRCRI